MSIQLFEVVSGVSNEALHHAATHAYDTRSDLVIEIEHTEDEVTERQVLSFTVVAMATVFIDPGTRVHGKTEDDRSVHMHIPADEGELPSLTMPVPRAEAHHDEAADSRPALRLLRPEE